MIGKHETYGLLSHQDPDSLPQAEVYSRDCFHLLERVKAARPVKRSQTTPYRIPKKKTVEAMKHRGWKDVVNAGFVQWPLSPQVVQNQCSTSKKSLFSHTAQTYSTRFPLSSGNGTFPSWKKSLTRHRKGLQSWHRHCFRSTNVLARLHDEGSFNSCRKPVENFLTFHAHRRNRFSKVQDTNRDRYAFQLVFSEGCQNF